jgi:hypothetical protein
MGYDFCEADEVVVLIALIAVVAVMTVAILGVWWLI